MTLSKVHFTSAALSVEPSLNLAFGTSSNVYVGTSLCATTGVVAAVARPSTKMSKINP
ncbi:MAG: hypothetical protein ACE5I5_13690 [Candidatus Heimdallarchaeota archaeon]